MTSCRVIALSSSIEYPRYVNSRLRRTSMPAARFRIFRRAALASPPVFFAMFAYPRRPRSRFGLGDIRPTFRPGGARHETVDGRPTC